MYHFLCDLQHQNQQSYYFGWGSFMKELFFLPRVAYKDIIFSKARWKIEKENLTNFKNLFGNTPLILDAVKTWREKLKLPQLVELVEGDNTLYINLSCKWSVTMLHDQIKNKKQFIIQEVFEEQNSVVKGSSKNFHNEVIFSFIKNIKPSLN